MDVTVLAVGLFIALAAGAWFFSLEIAGKQVDVVIVLLVVLVLDVVVYPESETAELPSYLNLSMGSQAIRLLQILLVAAVVARLLADGIPRRFTAAAPLWMAFFLWFLVSAVVGWLFGNASGLILRHLLLVVVIGAGLLVAGGVRAVDYVQSRNLQRFLVCAAVASVLLFITDTFGLTVTSTAVPGLPVVGLGTYGSDAATVFGSLGLIALGLGWASGAHARRRVLLLACGAVMILSLLASPQRAARLGIGVALVFVAAALLSPSGRRRLGLTGNALIRGCVTIAVVVCAAVFVAALVNGLQQPADSVTHANQQSAIGATTRYGSVLSRYHQWAVAWTEIQDSPLVGQGLGGTQIHFDEGQRIFVESDISHNIALDLLRRTGVLGLVLGAAAVIVLLWQCLGVWRVAIPPMLAFWALSASAVVVGLLAKGMVESIFEKDRLAVLLALALGFMSASALYEEPSPKRIEPARRSPAHSSHRSSMWGPALVFGSIVLRSRRRRAH